MQGPVDVGDPGVPLDDDQRATLTLLVRQVQRSLPPTARILLEVAGVPFGSGVSRPSGVSVPVVRVPVRIAERRYGWIEVGVPESADSGHNPDADELRVLAGELAAITEAYLTAVEREHRLGKRLRTLERERLRDPLTGAASRTFLDDRLPRAQAAAHRRNALVGLIYLDVDRFKSVNDGYGHLAGDQLLVELCSRLRTVIRPNDTLARVGGDEFVLLCEALMSRRQLCQIADRALEVARAPLPLGAGSVPPSVGGLAQPSLSLGLTVVEPDEVVRQAIERADAAMYRAKASGGDQWSAHWGDGEPATSRTTASVV